tara:strand:+ start:35874 stop:36728 length:855 start_codon:yes stop_codon:yes gene_type:complete
MKLQIAKREDVKLRIGLSGASGFGKTYSALLLAYGITNDWSKIAIIDTENSSANLYANLGSYNVLALMQPYNPERYIEAIRTCENASVEVIIIDSISHEWNGSGGCLEIHDKLGGRFQDWAKITPRHQAFIDTILQSKCHVITSVRSKTDYSMDADANGKTKVVKHGMKQITRDGFEYELSVHFEIINEQHLAKASKDRTGLFMGKQEFLIGKQTGKLLMQWCNENAEVQKAFNEIKKSETLEGLRHVYSKFPHLKNQIQESIMKRKEELESVHEHLVSDNKIN